MDIAEPSPDKPSNPETKPRRRWLKFAAWASVGLALFLVLAASVVAVVLRSTQFHNYVLNTLEKQASARLGTRVQVQNYTLHLRNLSADLYGLTVSGSAPYSSPPLLLVQHIEVGVRVVSVLHRKWYLDNLRIDRPILRVFVDGRGVSKIPAFRGGGGNSNNTLFDLAIRHAVLDQGEVDYNSKETSLEADLHDVEFASSFDSSLQKYSGQLSYVDGHLIAGSLKSIPHSLNAQFDATPTTLSLTKATLTSGRSQLVITASSEDYGSPRIQASYRAVLDGSEIRQILNSPSVPMGLINADGVLRYHNTATGSMLDSLVLNGSMNSRQLDVHTAKVSARIQDLTVRYALENGEATIQELHAYLLGGEIKASGKMAGIGGHSRSTLEVSLSRISLNNLRQTIQPSTRPQKIDLGGVLNAQANAAWGSSLDDLVAHANATVNGRIANAHAGDSGTIPVNSVIHGAYSAASKQLTFLDSYIRLPQTTLTMNGTVSNRSDLALLFQTNDLSEMEAVAGIASPAFGQPAPRLGLAGTASFRGAVQGSTATPHLTGHLIASDLHVNGTAWRRLQVDVDLSPSFAALRHGNLLPASNGQLTFDASTGLRQWSFTNTSPVQVTLDASTLDISDLAKFAKARIPLAGLLTASVKVQGSELSPAGTGKLSLTRAKIYDEPLQSAQLTFSGTGDQVQGNLSIQLPAGNVQSKISIRPREKDYSIELVAQQIRLDRLRTLKSRDIDANGAVNLHASGTGSFQNPQLTATVQIPQLEIQKQTITSLNLQMNVANHVATANLTSAAVGSSMRADVKVNLSGDYVADATLDTSSIPLEPLLTLYASSEADGLTGETELHGTLHGPLKNWKTVEAHIAIPTLKLAYGNAIQLAAVSPIRVDYKDGLLALERAEIRGTDTDLQFQGTFPLTGRAPMSLLLLGTVNLQLAQMFDSEVKSSGELKFNISSHGSGNGSSPNGQIEIVDANFIRSDLPVGLQHGNGVLTLTQDRLNITKFQATVGNGTLTAQGGVAYRPKIRFDLGLAVKDVRMLYPQGLRESVNADLRLGGSIDDALLGGTVNISDLSFTPAFDLTNFMNQFSGGIAAPPTPGFTQNLRLNVAVRASNDINLVSRTLSISGNANLQLRGTAAEPVILGRVSLNNGDIIFNGDRFVVNGGTIEFVNSSETQPVVNLALNTRIQQYDITMRFKGPIDGLRTDYSSDPSLPAADIINLLAFGQTTEANSANASTPANQQAESLVASQVSSQITDRVSKIAGISQLSINPVLAGGTTQGPPGANITVQQRVTGNLFVTFSTNVASTQNQVVMGQYQLSPRVAMSVTRDQSGGFAVDTLIKKTW